MTPKLVIVACCLGTSVFVEQAVEDVLRMQRIWHHAPSAVANVFLLVCHLSFIVFGAWSVRIAWRSK